ncbi:Rrf2 family transcriptional regulator [bacterium]|nr:Rrf2 family transcriptional regulator [bacterium]
MKISRKSDYALRILVTLTEHYGRGPIPIRELARRNDAPRRFLEHILLDLKSQKCVDSVPGRNGGYILAKNPEKITMGQIVRHFDGILAPIPCVSVTDYKKCTQEPVCRFRRVLLEIRNTTAEIMDRTTFASLVEVKPVSTSEVLKK